MSKAAKIGVGLLLMTMGLGCGPPDADEKLRAQIEERELDALSAPEVSAEKAELGRQLFFDPVISGNRDISCASCHLPSEGSGDGRALPIGTGSVGTGEERRPGPGRSFIPRNSPDLFLRGDPRFRVLMWDGRFQRNANGIVTTPAGNQLPARSLDDLLAIQAMFPVTSRDEMRGERGDLDIFGEPNEIAERFDSDFIGIWGALTRRLIEVERYRELFAAAYPETRPDEITFAHAANAISAFVRRDFTPLDSPWDRYARGQEEALSPAAKRGALLFYGDAGCADCHSGALLTDQDFHNIGVPQFGPGKQPEAPLDEGRRRHSIDPAMTYAFRTPPLRNLSSTAPYMHNGAYATLEGAVRHHLDPRRALETYDCSQLPEALRPSCEAGSSRRDTLLSTLDRRVDRSAGLDDEQVADLLAFLRALDSPSANSAARIPETVPSGLEPIGVR